MQTTSHDWRQWNCAYRMWQSVSISKTTYATIKDLHLVGCGGNRVSLVEQFIVEDTVFEGVDCRRQRYRALGSTESSD